MTIASDLFRTVTVKIHGISQQLPYIVVNQADDNGKIIRFVPMDHGQKVTGFTGARLYYPPRSDNEYGDYVTGVESDGAWDFTIPVGVLSAGRVGCNLAFIDGDGETYSRNVVFLVEPAVSGVFDPEDGQQTRLDKVIGTVQNVADTAIDSINDTVDNAVERVNKTASDAVESIGKAEESISESVTDARGSADAAANSANQAAVFASAAQVSERNATNSAMQASQSATAAKQSERNAASSERNAASSAESAANIVASVSGSVAQAEAAAQSASQSATSAAGSASAAGGSAQAAEDSASKAGKSATAAGASERNAASSAAQAAQSATAGAQSASKAQDAVDGFGLQVGTTTTGNPGTNAAVEIRKTGTKYTANFTIPRGDKGDAPSLSRTMADPKSQRWNAIDFNDFTENGVYTFNGYPTNSPRGDSAWITGTLIVSHSFQNIMQLCAYRPSTTISGFAFRNGETVMRPLSHSGISGIKSLSSMTCLKRPPWQTRRAISPACPRECKPWRLASNLWKPTSKERPTCLKHSKPSSTPEDTTSTISPSASRRCMRWANSPRMR